MVRKRGSRIRKRELIGSDSDCEHGKRARTEDMPELVLNEEKVFELRDRIQSIERSFEDKPCFPQQITEASQLECYKTAREQIMDSLNQQTSICASCSINVPCIAKPSITMTACDDINYLKPLRVPEELNTRILYGPK